MGRTTVGFSGDVAEYYAQYRPGYPPEVVDVLQAAFALTAEDAVLDLGCGTGQLAVPVASRVGSVIGMDPEPDMLRFARRAAAGRKPYGFRPAARVAVLPARRSRRGSTPDRVGRKSTGRGPGTDEFAGCPKSSP
ncbi:methyltransferase domain-containing protein [Streptomyces sp. 184]|uniref:methyltransferase domain-containing protein n=1 Tax=Streptomyces sp. 184 TaxID=1827526 RepID=UPI00389219E0